MNIVSENIFEKYIEDSKVELDPGLRTKIISYNQCLIIIGPHQPKLNFYQKRVAHRFNPSWYIEYSHLELITMKDAAFCFICSLFSDVVVC